MSTDIHCVLQKKNENGDFETVIKDVFGQDYQLFGFLSGVRGGGGRYDNIAHEGLPQDFSCTHVDEQGCLGGSAHYHDGFYMGEHSFGHLTLKEFCDAPTPNPPSVGERFEVEKHARGYTVVFHDLDDDDGYADAYYGIRAYQYALQNMFHTYSQGTEYGETYRLVFGYDS